MRTVDLIVAERIEIIETINPVGLADITTLSPNRVKFYKIILLS
jgi:hypothetical protein